MSRHPRRGLTSPAAARPLFRAASKHARRPNAQPLVPETVTREFNAAARRAGLPVDG